MDVKKDGKKMQQTAFYENVQQHQVYHQIVHHNWEKITLKSGAKFDAKSSFCCCDIAIAQGVSVVCKVEKV